MLSEENEYSCNLQKKSESKIQVACLEEHWIKKLFQQSSNSLYEQICLNAFKASIVTQIIQLNESQYNAA